MRVKRNACEGPAPCGPPESPTSSLLLLGMVGAENRTRLLGIRWLSMGASEGSGIGGSKELLHRRFHLASFLMWACTGERKWLMTHCYRGWESGQCLCVARPLTLLSSCTSRPWPCPLSTSGSTCPPSTPTGAEVLSKTQCGLWLGNEDPRRPPFSGVRFCLNFLSLFIWWGVPRT